MRTIFIEKFRLNINLTIQAPKRSFNQNDSIFVQEQFSQMRALRNFNVKIIKKIAWCLEKFVQQALNVRRFLDSRHICCSSHVQKLILIDF